MKKLLFTLLIMCVTVATAMAGSDIKVLKGDKKFFKTAQGTAQLEIVWDQAKYDNRMPLTEQFKDMTKYAEASWNGFYETFNDKCKKVKVVRAANSYDYKFTMRVSNVDQYLKVMGFVPGPATKIWGTLTISDAKTGEELVIIDVDYVDGGASPSPFESFSDSFEKLAEEVAHLK